MTSPGEEIWLRPEFKDRRDELISKSDAARLVRVAPQTVSSYERRFADFPRVVLAFTRHSEKMLHRGEFLEWHDRFTKSLGLPNKDKLVVARDVVPDSRKHKRAKLASLRLRRDELLGKLAGLSADIDKITESLLEGNDTGE